MPEAKDLVEAAMRWCKANGAYDVSLIELRRVREASDAAGNDLRESRIALQKMAGRESQMIRLGDVVVYVDVTRELVTFHRLVESDEAAP